MDTETISLSRLLCVPLFAIKGIGDTDQAVAGGHGEQDGPRPGVSVLWRRGWESPVAFSESVAKNLDLINEM